MKKVVSLFVFLLTVCSVQASLITFELLNQASVFDGFSSVNVTNSGVVVTISASEGVLNSNSDEFGINGAGSDDASGINAGQYLSLVFEGDVTFKNVNLSSWGVSDSGEVQLGPSFISQGALLGSGDTPYDFSVAAGTEVRIIGVTDTAPDNGFSVDSFTVSIPEPMSLSLFGLAGFGILVVRRKLRDS